MDLLIRYALSFLGSPYIWGGDDPSGWDCSGLVQEILSSIGIQPPGDNTAQMLYNHFYDKSQIGVTGPGALVFYGKDLSRITHIAFMVDRFRTVQAAGGGSKTLTPLDAARQNAFVKMRPMDYRSDRVVVLMPDYKSLGII